MSGGHWSVDKDGLLSPPWDDLPMSSTWVADALNVSPDEGYMLVQTVAEAEVLRAELADWKRRHAAVTQREQAYYALYQTASQQRDELAALIRELGEPITAEELREAVQAGSSVPEDKTP